MDAQDLEKIVTLGLGRAVLHLREHDARPYRAIILHACVHNRAYDAQIEGPRAEYALDLMRHSGDVQFYEDVARFSRVDVAARCFASHNSYFYP